MVLSDLMCLRIVSWLRRPKQGHLDQYELPASPMPQVRKALQTLSDLGLDLWFNQTRRAPCWLTCAEESGCATAKAFQLRKGKRRSRTWETFGLTDPYDGGLRGPDLVKPRPHLRIIPGKLAGEPHVANTRLTSAALARPSLQRASTTHVSPSLYEVDVSVVEEAVDLERQASGVQTAA